MTLLVAAAVGLFVLVVFLAIIEIRDVRKSASRLARIRKYSPRSEATSALLKPGSIMDILSEANRRFSKTRWAKSYILRSENAGFRIKPLTWVAYVLGSAVGFSLLLLTVVPFLPVAVIIGFGLALLGSRTLVVARENKRQKMFEQELPEFLLLISSSLRSGLSLTQSLESVSQQGNGEVERQIRRATSEINMGMTPNDALMEVAIRMKSPDMRWVNVAIAIQREVGGNLSVILDSVAETVRERANIKREVSTLSAESRLSAWVLLALPIAVFVFFYLFRRDYVAFFWTTVPGLLMLGLFVLLVGSGALWMRSLIRIQV